MLLYTTETSELIGLCHRVLSWTTAGSCAELDGGEITEANILSASLGLGRDRDPLEAGETAEAAA